ncbi:SGNH/GDSL hydrolase family protein [Neobacillus sp. M.A.Huq-85]
MKNFLTVLLGIICVAILFWGHSYYNQKIEAASNKGTEISEGAGEEAVEQSIDIDDLTKNWPDKAVGRMKQTIKEKKKFKLLLVGNKSDAKSYKDVKEKLTEAFGDHISVSIVSFNETSTKFVEEKDLADKKADLFVLEPFLVADNGVVVIDDTLKNVSKITEQVVVSNPDASLVLQPSYPIYQAKYYPIQVEELKKFAEKKDIPFLDHWSAWPDYQKEEIKDYLLPDQSGPNEKGIQVWSDYLLHYLMNS